MNHSYARTIALLAANLAAGCLMAFVCLSLPAHAFALETPDTPSDTQTQNQDNDQNQDDQGSQQSSLSNIPDVPDISHPPSSFDPSWFSGFNLVGNSTFTIHKVLKQDNGGTEATSTFSVKVLSLTSNGFASSNYTFDNTGTISIQTPALGVYWVKENDAPGYTASYSNCTKVFMWSLLSAQPQTCTITNDDTAPSLTLTATVNGAAATSADWTLTATGPSTLTGNTPVTSGPTFKAGAYTLSESGPSGYTAGSWSCTSGSLSGNTLTLGIGQTATCTIDNTSSGNGGNGGDGGTGDQCVVVSDTTTQEAGHNSVLVSLISSAWTAVLNGGSWIWGEDPVADPVNGGTETFTKTFYLASVPTSAALVIAADNGYSVSVNGHVIHTDPGEFNYTAAGQDTITVPAADLVSGANTLEATVTNVPFPGGTVHTNPAGLLYTLTVNGTKCGTPPPPAPKVNVVATKIVCDNETDLPNWGKGGHTINASTASDFLAGHPGCHVQPGWSFEWGNQSAGDAGDAFVGPAGHGYTTFGPTDASGVATTSVAIDGISSIHMREVLQNGYIPFTHAAHPDNSDDVSAEFYCANDALNYDNLDYINAPQNGSTYYCVAFNAPKQPVTPTTLKVHIFKYLDNGETDVQIPDDSNAPSFPMQSTWQTTNLSSGATSTGTYVLGTGFGDASVRYGADTSPMDAPAYYTTHEMVDNSTTVANANVCSLGKYYLEGYKTGDSLTAAENADATSTVPEFFGLTADKYVIVVNKACPADNDGGDGSKLNYATTTVHAEDLATTKAEAKAHPNWFFYDDNTDTVNDALGSFVTGPATAPLGTGSAQITLDATNNRTDIATYQFSGVKLADITSLKFSTYSHSGSGISAHESPYLVFNVTFDGNDTWQKRLVYVPANNGAVPQDGWNTFDAINGGNAMWVYSGLKWPGTSTPGTTARNWADLLASYPNIAVLTTDSFMGVRVGEPGPTGYTGNIDDLQIGIKTGSNVNTTTFDFEPTATDNTPNNNTPINNNGGGGDGGTSGQFGGHVLGNFIGPVQGEVLGASCSPILTSYLRMGKNNPVDQVKILQDFLNGELSLNLPVTGFFGNLTKDAVNQFQLKYASDVLSPWIPFGHPSDSVPTGYVYKTTQYKINLIACATADIQKPILP